MKRRMPKLLAHHAVVGEDAEVRVGADIPAVPAVLEGVGIPIASALAGGATAYFFKGGVLWTLGGAVVGFLVGIWIDGILMSDQGSSTPTQQPQSPPPQSPPQKGGTVLAPGVLHPIGSDIGTKEPTLGKNTHTLTASDIDGTPSTFAAIAGYPSVEAFVADQGGKLTMVNIPPPTPGDTAMALAYLDDKSIFVTPSPMDPTVMLYHRVTPWAAGIVVNTVSNVAVGLIRRHPHTMRKAA